MAEDDDPHNSFRDTAFGIGQRADGTIDTFPLSQLAERTKARDAEEEESAEDVMKRADKQQQAEIAALESEADGDVDVSDLDDEGDE